MIRISKRSIPRIFLGCELFVFFGFYLLGSNGLASLLKLKKDIYQSSLQLDELKHEVTQLVETLALQSKHPFFQEKIAREQLQMARKDEEIYLID